MKLISRRKCVPNKAAFRENSPEHTYLKKNILICKSLTPLKQRLIREVKEESLSKMNNREKSAHNYRRQPMGRNK